MQIYMDCTPVFVCPLLIEVGDSSLGHYYIVCDRKGHCLI